MSLCGPWMGRLYLDAFGLWMAHCREFPHDAFAHLERTHTNFTPTASLASSLSWCSWNAKPPRSCLVGDREGNK